MIFIPEAERPPADGAAGRPLSRHAQLHLEAHRRGWTRRQFMKMGVAFAGAGLLPGKTLGGSLRSGLPHQLPYTSPVLKEITGLDIPFFLPAEVDPFTGGDADPTTIADFKGYTGLIEAHGVSDAAHNADGVPRTWACDVRYMKGVFVNRAGRKQ